MSSIRFNCMVCFVSVALLASVASGQAPWGTLPLAFQGLGFMVHSFGNKAEEHLAAYYKRSAWQRQGLTVE
nr:hypothetical protein [uncultured Rhodoferax sp.]